jgi:hypothetical protein
MPEFLKLRMGFQKDMFLFLIEKNLHKYSIQTTLCIQLLVLHRNRKVFRMLDIQKYYMLLSIQIRCHLC